MKKSSLKSKAFITALSALGVASVGAAAAQADTYTIKNGDTLWRLAREHGTSVDALAIANKVSDPNLIIAGNTLLFSDTDQTAVASPAQQVAQSSSAASSSAASSASSSSVVSASTDAQTTPYTVQAGDSLWLIAQQTGTNVDDLVKANGGKSLINVGQTIQIDQASASSTAVTSAAPVQTSSSAEETAASSASDQPTSASTASSTADTSSAAASSAYASSVAASQAAQSAANSVAASQAAASAAASSAYASSVAASQAAQSAANAAAAKAKAAAASKSKAIVKTTAYTPAASSSTVQTVINLAVQLSKQNIPYVWGGSTTAGFDCSGLVSYVFQRAGISLPHYTVSQESYVSKHSVASAKPGDLLFWGNVGASYHVAIYIGNGQYVAAPEPGKNVEIETISSYFMPSFAGTVIH
ncbi:peptidoglycan endopeptidase [Oenococcus sicerae]|uniref:Peptidoglycan endopeptidase n=1 Tax=Oenococcus sicerae TaxID=2203724 RepID=A0AAJ1R7F3_9LACO|nr:peptidoglycan endopeptidase [Oenococcus sicerae]MDN6899504.1 peptidoglycan endopeptidase [Oenococcus sicerae]